MSCDELLYENHKNVTLCFHEKYRMVGLHTVNHCFQLFVKTARTGFKNLKAHTPFTRIWLFYLVIEAVTDHRLQIANFAYIYLAQTLLRCVFPIEHEWKIELLPKCQGCFLYATLYQENAW